MTVKLRQAAVAMGMLTVTCAWPPSVAGVDGLSVPAQTKLINELLAKSWADNKIQPSRKCTDHEFIRRVFLDLIGRIPKTDEVDSFMKQPAATRRAVLIEKLLHHSDYSTEYARHWADVWSVWLLTRTGNATYREQMHVWLEDQFNKNASHKEIVTALLTATGKTNDNQAVNYILSNLGEQNSRGKQLDEGHFEVVPVTSRTTRLFLGLQTQCVQCHDHPFNPEWKQSSFWGVNVFFRQVERVGTPNTRDNPRVQVAPILELRDDPKVNKDAIVYFERRNGMIQASKAVFVDGKKVETSPGQTRREQLADLVVTHDNFGKEYVNRMWGHLFGRGLNEQPAVDDFGDHNKVVHPELLDGLAKAFVENGHYSSKALFSWICNSDAYQLSSVPNSTNDKPDTDVFFSRMLLKSMTPEQLLDSLWVATRGNLAGDESNTIAARRKEWTAKLVRGFGDDEGNEVTFNGTVVQALLMMNGREINEAIRREGGTVAQALKHRRHGDIVKAIYIAALSRPPAANEPAAISRIADRSGGKLDQTFYGDVLWALLNSNEFILNH